MPYRDEEELDSVTLHNQALIQMEDEPTNGFEKLNYLLTVPDCPPETLSNLLLLYLKFGYNDFAADLLAENRYMAEITMGSVHIPSYLMS
jgi:tetratricopeptide repeat protein 30